MAEKLVSIEVTVLQRQWLAKALDTQRKVLVRSRSSEMAGSEIFELRGREIAAVDELIAKVR